jgi:hypothetical protein
MDMKENIPLKSGNDNKFSFPLHIVASEEYSGAIVTHSMFDSAENKKLLKKIVRNPIEFCKEHAPLQLYRQGEENWFMSLECSMKMPDAWYGDAHQVLFKAFPSRLRGHLKLKAESGDSVPEGREETEHLPCGPAIYAYLQDFISYMAQEQYSEEMDSKSSDSHNPSSQSSEEDEAKTFRAILYLTLTLKETKKRKRTELPNAEMDIESDQGTSKHQKTCSAPSSAPYLSTSPKYPSKSLDASEDQTKVTTANNNTAPKSTTGMRKVEVVDKLHWCYVQLCTEHPKLDSHVAFIKMEACGVVKSIIEVYYNIGNNCGVYYAVQRRYPKLANYKEKNDVELQQIMSPIDRSLNGVILPDNDEDYIGWDQGKAFIMALIGELLSRGYVCVKLYTTNDMTYQYGTLVPRPNKSSKYFYWMRDPIEIQKGLITIPMK